MKILFLGDIMPGGVLPYQEKYMDDDLLSYMQSFDLRVGTLECGVGTDIPFDEVKMANTKSIVYARDEDMVRLREMNINVVSLANNHAFDLGLEGMEHVVKLLDSMGIKHFGSGHNIEEARKPAVVEMNGKTITFIGCMMEVPLPTIFHKATVTDFGVYKAGIDEIVKDIVRAKTQYDYVIVMPHWGKEHSYCPPAYCKTYAKRMLAAGADCVVGSHPHIINPVVTWGGKHCYFSLGNFLFPEKCLQVPRPMYYPATAEECRSLKRVWTYPKSVSEPVVAVWKPKNRIGMMVEMELGGRIRDRYELTCLTSDNVLHHYSSFLVRARMAFWAMLMHLPKYGFVRRVYTHRCNFVRRMVNKLSAFNIPVEL